MPIIRVVDLETTGFEPPEAEVCEIAFVDVVGRPDLAGGYANWIVGPKRGSTLVRTERPVTPVSSSVHHIVDADLEGAPSWFEAQEHVFDDEPIAYAAHSAKFERQFCTEDITGETAWICTYKCGLRAWPDAPSHSNMALRYWRNPEGLKREEAMPAHRALPDAYVTAFHLRDLLNAYPLADLIKWSSEPALQVTCHIGKFRGARRRDGWDARRLWCREPPRFPGTQAAGSRQARRRFRATPAGCPRIGDSLMLSDA
ncbi:MAG: exonuclease domain-containing protein [Pseudomonadota bacterium]